MFSPSPPNVRKDRFLFLCLQTEPEFNQTSPIKFKRSNTSFLWDLLIGIRQLPINNILPINESTLFILTI